MLAAVHVVVCAKGKKAGGRVGGGGGEGVNKSAHE